jgi:very-short-patch-repair endonuclease
VSFVGVTATVDAEATVASEATVDSVDAEVARVVSLVLDHAVSRADESLGVITMGVVHADRISSALRAALRSRPDLHDYFDENRPEPFFVKNLERVQGDERDAIVLSIGYGKGADGRLLYRFGPLLLSGGHRRLNVAVTRARRRMTLVCSFRSTDLDPARTTAEGVRLLRAYLQYAESGGVALGAATTAKPVLNPFEVDVRDCLVEAGIPVEAQYGVAGYFIDFAAAHPTRRGEMVLAIEADGASYHSSGTVRDRDRLRQEHLERLGWSFHRIWSTDWFADPAVEVERVRAAYRAAVDAADARHARLSAPPGADAPPRSGAAPGSGCSGALDLEGTLDLASLELEGRDLEGRDLDGRDLDGRDLEGRHLDGMDSRTGDDGPVEGPTGGLPDNDDVRHVSIDPVSVDRAPTEPIPTDPIPTDPIPTDPIPTDPTPTVRLSDLAGRPGIRPVLPYGEPIGSYHRSQLVALVRWIESDTLLRTEEQLLDEVMRELGFQRKGPRIREALLTAIRTSRR